ncbi:MAG: hypothetical protein EOM62_18105 [Bacteroidia bacterium]|nr:hypothetical protein [Bacteroidia bacterium]
MKTCQFEGCNGKVHGKGYCHKHWQQFYRHGKIFEHTRYDAPNIEIDGNIAYLPLHNNKGEKIIDVLIDASEAEWVGKYKWFRGSKGHILNKCVGSLARKIIKAKPGEIVDHINRNTFDNRRTNLRIVSLSENVRNSKIPLNNKSGVKGVYFHKCTRKWEAFIRINGERRRAYFSEYEDAVKCRSDWETELNYNP